MMNQNDRERQPDDSAHAHMLSLYPGDIDHGEEVPDKPEPENGPLLPDYIPTH